MYVLIRLLHEESEMIQQQMQLMSDGRLLRYVRRKYADINTRLETVCSEKSVHLQSVTSGQSILVPELDHGK